MNPPFSRTLAVQAQHNWPLHNTASTRKIEHELQAQLPHHTLMQRAGLASAQLALAVAPLRKPFGSPVGLVTTAVMA